MTSEPLRPPSLRLNEPATFSNDTFLLTSLRKLAAAAAKEDEEEVC
jgi:hypothetical protein